MSTKKGLSLIEVVVALSIIAIVFTGTITLMIRGFNLEIMARDRTEAITIAQTKLTDKAVEIEQGCGNNYIGATTESGLSGTNNRYSWVVSVNDSPAYETGLGINGTNFIEIRSTVTWTPKGSSQETFEIRQLVRK